MDPVKAPAQDQAWAGTCSEELLVESELGPGYTLVYPNQGTFSPVRLNTASESFSILAAIST